MRIAICDDDKNFCIKLEQYIDEYSRRRNFEFELKIYNLAEGLLNKIKTGYVFDVIFLDIYMDEIDGIETGRLIRNELKAIHTEIVFTTNSSDHYKDAVGLRVFHYLKKPINQMEFENTFQKIIEYCDLNPKLYTYQKMKVRHYVRLGDIVYFEAQNRQVIIVTINGKDTFYGSMKEVVSSLDSVNFIKPHRAYLVNMNYIVEHKGKNLILLNNEVIPVSNKRKKDIEEKLMRASIRMNQL